MNPTCIYECTGVTRRRRLTRFRLDLQLKIDVGESPGGCKLDHARGEADSGSIRERSLKTFLLFPVSDETID